MMTDKENSSKKKVRIHVTGMTCTTCAATIEKGLAGTAGVEEAKVNFASEQASVEYDSEQVDLGKLKETISSIGYNVATRKLVFPVRGMTCAPCAARVERALSGVPGVVSANVNLASEKATVQYLEGVQFSELKQAVADAGYELGKEAETLEDVSVAVQKGIKSLRNRFIFAGIIGAADTGAEVRSAVYGETLPVVGAGNAGAVLGGLAVLPRHVGSLATPDGGYEHPYRDGYFCRLNLQRNGRGLSGIFYCRGTGAAPLF